ncbi:hypothetical protein Tco_1249904 [Tanacetum coccineum]
MVPRKSHSKKESAVKPKVKKVATPKQTNSSQKKTPTATKSCASGSKMILVPKCSQGRRQMWLKRSLLQPSLIFSSSLESTPIPR